MIKPLISVIVPVYNVEKYVGKCLDSIIRQVYKNLEIIVVDDGSTDHSSDICKDYAKKDKRIKIIRQKNGGASSARNAGLSATNGEYICFIDSDDTIEPNHIKDLYISCKKEQADVAVCGINFIKNGVTTRPFKIRPDVLNRYDYIYGLIYELQGYTHNKLYSTSIIKGINFNKDFLICEDYLFNMEVALKVTKAVVVTNYSYNYICTDSSIMHNKYSSKNITELRSRDAIYSLIKDNFPDLALLFLVKSVAAAYRQKYLYKKSSYRNQKIYTKIIKYIQNNEQIIFRSHKIPTSQKIQLLAYKYGYPLIYKIRHLKNKLNSRSTQCQSLV